MDQVTRTEYMALPYEAKKRLLLAEFETGRELIEHTRLMVARHKRGAKELALLKCLPQTLKDPRLEERAAMAASK